MAIDRAFLNANHAALVAEILAEGHVAGVKEGAAAGAAAELARIKAVKDVAMPGCDTLLAQLMFDGKTTGPEAAVQILAHYKGQNAGALDKLAKDAGAMPAVPANPSPNGDAAAAAAAAKASEDASKPLEERCKAKWDADAAIRAEFTDLKAYTAFVRADEAGKVKILGKKAA